GVAHEFNNLLAGISGYASLALHEPDLGGAARTFLQNVVGLSERAAKLTRQLLIYARKADMTRRPTSAVELVTATVDLLRQTLGPEIALEVPPAAAVAAALLVSADANQLQQALVNLALNARDAIIAGAEQGEKQAEAPAPILFRVRSAVLPAELKAFPQNV